VGPRPGLEDAERRKTLPSTIPPGARRYTDCTIPAPIGIRYYFHCNLHGEGDGREIYSAIQLGLRMYDMVCSVLCWPVSTEFLRWIDYQCKDYYGTAKNLILPEVNSE
jgi:hypothetical protein